MNRIVFIVIFVALGLPLDAHAHLVSTRFGELYSGVLHPITTLLHLVPWLALGLLGGLQSPTTARWSLVCFPLAVFVGGLLTELLPTSGFIETFNIVSFVVLGLLVALALKLGLFAFLAIVVVFGVSHGYANAVAEFRGGAWLLYMTGVVLAAYVLIALSAGAAHRVVAIAGWGPIAVRAAGSWIAAAGVMYLGFVFFVA